MKIKFNKNKNEITTIYLRSLLIVTTIYFTPLISSFGQNIDYDKIYKNISVSQVATDLTDSLFSACNKDQSCINNLIKYLSSSPPNENKIVGLTEIAVIYNGIGKTNESLKIYKLTLKKAQQINAKKIGRIYSSIADVYTGEKQLDSAIYFNGLALESIYASNLKNDFWMPYFNLYSIYKASNQNDKALENLKKAYLFANPEVRMDKGYILYTLIMNLYKTGSKVELDKYINEYVNFKKHGTTSKLTAEHIGLDELVKGDTSYVKILEDKITKVKKAPISFLLKDFYIDLAKIYLGKNQYNKAEKALFDAELVSQEHDEDISWVYYKIYKARNNLNQALTNLENYTALKDSAYKESYKNSLADFEVKYDTQQKEVEIEKQKRNISENKLKLRTSYGFLIGLSGLLFLSFLFYKNRIKHQNIMRAKEQEIQNQKIKQLEQENKVLALNSMIEGQEAERLRIAHDLHDGLGGLLTTVKAHFSAIEREINAVKNLNLYEKTNSLIDEACVEVRRIAHNMVPHSIQISGLSGALQDLSQSIITRGLTCDLDLHDIDDLKIDSQKSSMIYRIIQELTSNTIKHAHASHIFIQLMVVENELKILVEDNGKGFDINNILSNKGMGIKSIDSRINYLNGSIHYDSSPNHGTTVNMSVPIN